MADASASMTEAGIERLAVAWYKALDDHAPIEDVYLMLAEDGLNVQFPDGDIKDYNSFKKWYDRVTNLFFDENHFVQKITTNISGGEAVVDIQVGWQASWWVAPDAKSKRLSMDATQRWTVRPSKRNRYGLEIVTYNATVAPFKFAPGFATL
jgi:hypothetical protein